MYHQIYTFLRSRWFPAIKPEELESTFKRCRAQNELLLSLEEETARDRSEILDSKTIIESFGQSGAVQSEEDSSNAEGGRPSATAAAIQGEKYI